MPALAASLTRAHSVGSPTASPFSSSHLASEHSAMPARNFSSEHASSCLTTVILFWVRVPVLSEQMIWVQPRVSTAVILRIIA